MKKILITGSHGFLARHTAYLLKKKHYKIYGIGNGKWTKKQYKEWGYNYLINGKVNLINLLMPLSIKIDFQHANLKDLDKLKNILGKINIIDSYTLDEFNINNSSYKIYYYGNPKKLKSELSKFGYQLRNDQGYWQIYLNE